MTQNHLMPCVDGPLSIIFLIGSHMMYGLLPGKMFKCLREGVKSKPLAQEATVNQQEENKIRDTMSVMRSWIHREPIIIFHKGAI